MNVSNNMIVNNVSTHEGGGIALDDAPNVRVFNNTIMKNLTTATAVTSDGQPAPAGLSTVGQQRPAAGHPAGRLADLQQPAAVQQHLLGQPGRHARGHDRHRPRPRRRRQRRSTTGTSASPTAPASLAPTNSVIQQNAGDHPYTTSPTNSSADPQRRRRLRRLGVLRDVAAEPGLRGRHARGGRGAARTSSATTTWRPAPARPPATSARRPRRARLPGAAGHTAAPAFDYRRPDAPALGGFDAGADEFGGLGATSTRDRRPLLLDGRAPRNPPGVAGTADDADVYRWNGTALQPSIDTHRRAPSACRPLPTSTASPGSTPRTSTCRSATTRRCRDWAPVQDEDVVYRNGSTGGSTSTARHTGWPSANLDIDAISVVGGVLYFSTAGNTNPPGVGGTADDADIYRWNGSDLRAGDRRQRDRAVPSATNVDGFELGRTRRTATCRSAADTTVTGLGTVQDEDVITRSGRPGRSTSTARPTGWHELATSTSTPSRFRAAQPLPPRRRCS